MLGVGRGTGTGAGDGSAGAAAQRVHLCLWRQLSWDVSCYMGRFCNDSTRAGQGLCGQDAVDVTHS